MLAKCNSFGHHTAQPINSINLLFPRSTDDEIGEKKSKKRKTKESMKKSKMSRKKKTKKDRRKHKRKISSSSSDSSSDSSCKSSSDSDSGDKKDFRIEKTDRQNPFRKLSISQLKKERSYADDESQSGLTPRITTGLSVKDFGHALLPGEGAAMVC